MTLQLSDKEFNSIADYIITNYGINLSKKKTLIEGRLGFYVSDQGYSSYHDFFEHAKNDPSQKEMESIISKLTTNHTYFMREHEHFDFFRDTVLPWIDNTLEEKDLRVWSAGCATGEEPYTLAMYSMEYVNAHKQKAGWDTTILASDISPQALTRASNGIYLASNMTALPEQLRNTYFNKISEDEYAVKDFLRKSVAFKKINLLDDISFKKQMHCIFCRNVMIYFDADTKTTLLNKIYDLLVPGGYFFIGHSESLATLNHKFKYIKPAVYRKP